MLNNADDMKKAKRARNNRRKKKPYIIEMTGDASSIIQDSGVQYTANAMMGFVTKISEGVIEGWALDRFDLSQHPRVRVLADGREVGEAVCDIFRDDLRNFGAGDGRYGFRISSPSALFDSARLTVLVVGTNPPYRLPFIMDATTVSAERFLAASTTPAATRAKSIDIVFDVSDLIQYFHNARLPTGIQRVQIEIITNFSFDCCSNFATKIAAFSKEVDFWVELPKPFFSKICKLSLIGGHFEAKDWQNALHELDEHLSQARNLAFPRGAFLINLGTSWWLQNYFLNIRVAKERYDIRYVPFVHDCIPVITPEHCTADLTRDFISWVQGAFQHADHFFVNSNATARDLLAVGRYLGHEIMVPEVVRLDADYRRANAMLRRTDLAESIDAESRDTQVFLRNHIRQGAYVLFVSTIESRKNHLAAFSAWLSLIKRHGITKVPHLVCVGNRGWLNDAVYSKLAASNLLRQRVVMLSNIPDIDLEVLYANCLFTLYPSSYEGWGLPVTEALSYGKVSLLANGSSLPEAGGDFAEYFELGSENDLLAKLDRLIYDSAYRETREAYIRANFRAREWRDIAKQLLDTITGWSLGDEKKGTWLFCAEPGRFHGFTVNQSTELSAGMQSGEIFRQGDSWWWPEPWGCWTKNWPARIAFRFHMPEPSPMVLFLGIKGVQGQPCIASISIEGAYGRQIALAPDQDQWLKFRVGAEVVSLLPRQDGDIIVELICSSDRWSNFAENTNGADRRIAGLGVRGFMICREDDIMARMQFLEAVALDDLFALSDLGRPLAIPEFLSQESSMP